MKKALVSLCLTCLIFAGCRKENDNPQWDIAVIGPVMHSTLTVEQLIADSMLFADGSGAQYIDYTNLFSTFDLDTLAQVNDTSISTINRFPPFPANLPPGYSFGLPNNKIVLGLGNLQLKEAIIDSGKIRLDIKNTVKSKLLFTYTIPKATKNGIPFSTTATVDSGSYTNPKYFSGEFDLRGYTIDLTGATGTSFNTITYDVKAIADTDGYALGFPVNPNDTILNLTTTLLSLKPSYAKGYLGQDQNSNTQYTDLSFMHKIKSGLIHLDSISMDVDLVNSIGADAQIYFNGITSINSNTGGVVSLVSPSIIQHILNINRATETNNPAAPVLPTNYSVHLDNINSNILPFIENIPDKFLTDFTIKMNPLGNVSGSNDFIYTDYLLDTRLKVKMPLRFAMNQLVMADTVPFNLTGSADSADLSQVGDMQLRIVASNGFPMDLTVQIFLLDSMNNITDSLFAPDKIARAPVDVNYRSIGTTRTVINMTIDAAKKNRLLNVKRAGVRIKFDTPDYPQIVQLYSDYRLDLKLIADGIYSIR
jgi:hypothetical protein